MMRPSPPSRAEPIRARWLAAARSLAPQAGIEFSARLSSRGLDDDRFLVTLSGQDWRGRVDPLLAEMQFPPASLDALREALAKARFLHLGYEGRHGAPLLKLYCEFRATDNERCLVHHAFKWQPQGGDAVIDAYWLRPPRPLGLAATEFAAVAPGLAQAIGTILEKAAARMRGGFTLLDVERGGARRSCDVRLYDAGLTLNDAADPIAAAGAALGCETRAWLGAHGGEALGHLSAGRTGGGENFLTVYHGGRPL